MPILAMSAGKVTAIWGSAYVRSPGGAMRALQVGDTVAGGERIITEDNGLVQISPIKGPAVLVKAVPVSTTVDKTIAGIDAQDPDQAPAAGLSGGADGGMQPGLRVDRVVETVGQVSFDFGTSDRAVAVPLSVSNVKNGVLQEAEPQISINSVTVNEGAGSAVFTVTLDKPSNNVVTVSFSTGDDTAVATGDFKATSGTVTFQPGQVSQTISVPLINDAIYEGSEQFTVKLSGASNAAIQVDTGTGIILDNGQGAVPSGVTPDDDRPHVLSVSDAVVVEGGSLDFIVKLDHSSTTDTILRLDLIAGDVHPATPGTDTGDMQVFLGDGPIA
ncbi:MAG: hypothetical protein EPO09_03615, partial [Aquabacterium sp.]|uniref:Calx-beta domain-containing protein n=1 Tax=Aquabacterium sp. TaxID=1872578 RepID=UPI0012270E36